MGVDFSLIEFFVTIMEVLPSNSSSYGVWTKLKIVLDPLFIIKEYFPVSPFNIVLLFVRFYCNKMPSIKYRTCVRLKLSKSKYFQPIALILSGF